MESLTATLFDIRHFAMHDGPGVRTTIFLKGCPLRCLWCHNPEGRSPLPDTIFREARDHEDNNTRKEEVIGKTYTPDELMTEILSEKNVMNGSGGGVTFSGGEPLLQHRFLLEMLKRCRAEGLHTAIDTNGYAEREVFEALMPVTNLWLFDIKHADSEKHLHHTAVSTVRILENLRLLLTSGAEVWLRVPVIPGFNDTCEEMTMIIRVLRGMPVPVSQVQLIPFRQVASEKYTFLGYDNTMSGIPSMHPAQLIPFRRMFRRAGFPTMIGG